MENRLSGNETWFRIPGIPKKKNNVGEFILVPMSSITTNLSQLINVYR